MCVLPAISSESAVDMTAARMADTTTAARPMGRTSTISVGRAEDVSSSPPNKARELIPPKTGNTAKSRSRRPAPIALPRATFALRAENSRW